MTASVVSTPAVPDLTLRPWPAWWVVARQSARLMRSEAGSLVTVFVMPIVLMTFFKPVARQALVMAGYHHVNGSEQVVPGMTVGFGTFMLSYVAFSFMGEYGWGTWERLRASRASSAAIVIGKLIPSMVVCVMYEVILFLFGVAVFGLRFHGHPLALVLTGLAFPACLVTAGIFLVAVCRTDQQINVIGNIGGIFLGALGGGYVPLSLLPSWARDIAPLTPTYWAVKGLRAGVLPGYSASAGLVSAAVLLGVAAAFAVGAAFKFRFEETKPQVG